MNKNLNKNMNKAINKTKDSGFITIVIVVLIIAIISIIALAVISRNSLYYSKINNAISPIIIYDDQKSNIGITKEQKNTLYNNVKFIENKTRFSISLWVYIDNWEYNYGKYKILYERRINNDIFTPVIAIDKYENNLVFGMSIYNKDEDPDVNINHKFVKFVHKKLPLQKWVNIIYNVSDKFVSLYLNGYIEDKYYLDNIFYQKGENEKYEYDILGKSRNYLDIISDSDGGLDGYSGRISKFQYFGKNLSNDEIRKIYENGPYID